jgi:membrane fusion protein, multidrug efflux system
MTYNKRIASAVLIGVIVAGAVVLGLWKHTSISAANAAAANQPEPMESVMATVAKERQHSPTTTVIGTVVALRSITLQNEVAGTVRRVALMPGQIVEPCSVLFALDVSVE